MALRLQIGLCRELPPVTGTDAPAWIPVFPKGPEIKGLDGRTYTLANPADLVAKFRAAKLQKPIDLNHSTEIRAPKGEESPAVGWFEELEVRDGEVWGRVTWNKAGTAAVSGREYRYVSPAFTHDRQNRVHELSSAGLTNHPNFVMPALNRQGEAEETSMIPKSVLIKLGLAETATEAEVLVALNAKFQELELATARAVTPPLEKFVPRAEFDVALARATKAENEIATARKTSLEQEIAGEIQKALEAGKITPATKDFYVATCRKDGGLEEFRKFIATAAQIVAPSTLGDKKPPVAGAVELDAVQLAVCRNMGITPDDFKKSLAAKA